MKTSVLGYDDTASARIVADALRSAVTLDLRAARELLEVSGGGLQILHTSGALEVRVEVLPSPGPGAARVEHSDTLYVVLDGNATLGVADADPLALVAGEAAVVPAGVRHVVFGNPRLSLLVVSASGPRVVPPLALCRRT